MPRMKASPRIIEEAVVPIPGARYRVKKTSKGNVRLAFKGSKVVEAKNLKTGKIHTMQEMMADHLRKGKFKGRKKR